MKKKKSKGLNMDALHEIFLIYFLYYEAHLKLNEDSTMLFSFLEL